MTELAFISRSSTPADRLHAIEHHIATARTIGLDVPEPILRNVQIARDLENLTISQGPDFEETQARLARAVIDGTVSVEDAVDQVVEAHRLTARGSAGAEFVATIATQAATNVWYSFEAHADEHWRKLFPAAHDKIIQRAVKAAQSIEGIRTVEAAVRARQGDAWAAAEDAHADWATLHSIADGFRLAGLDKSVPNKRGRQIENLIGSINSTEFRFAEPTRATAIRQKDYGNPGQWLAAAAADCEPGVLTIAQALDNRVRDAQRTITEREQAAPYRDRSSGWTPRPETMDEIVAEAEARAATLN